MRERVKHKPVKQNNFFKLKEGKIERTKKNCERCGDGTFMADHENRWYCGKCRLTIWKKSG
jgi:small subunit ribosomal protein S27Ae